ncbi:MAG: hypothetical protein U0791_27525 [Gemmataceae bacterium]
MSPLKQFRLAAVAGLVLAGGARAADKPATQLPVRAVYVTGQDGNPRVMYVTGTVPPEKLPTVAPVAPSNVPAPNRVVPARRDVPAKLPDVAAPAPAPVVEAAPPTASSSCTTGHCGPKCKHGPTSFWTCMQTPATVPPPLGSSVRSVFDMQRDNALAEYFVIYREDWHDARTDLNDTGARHMDGVIRRYGMIGAPVKVEPTGNADLDQKRVTAVIGKLAASGIPAQEAASRVVLGTSRAEGLRYEDIENVGRNTRGFGGGAGGGFGGAFGGFGGGFGGIGGFGFR